MRKLLVLGIVLLLLPVVTAQALCGDGVISTGEQCDDGNTNDGDGCSSICLTEVDTRDVLFDMSTLHTLLLGKTALLADLNKRESFQIESKVIQKELIHSYKETRCEELPLLFAMPISAHPFGKLEEVNEFNAFWFAAIADHLNNFGITEDQFDQALFLESLAEQSISQTNFISAAQQKCCAYNQLRVETILNFFDNQCFECGDGILDPGEDCDDGNNEDGDDCPADCTLRKEPRPRFSGGSSSGTGTCIENLLPIERPNILQSRCCVDDFCNRNFGDGSFCQFNHRCTAPTQVSRFTETPAPSTPPITERETTSKQTAIAPETRCATHRDCAPEGLCKQGTCEKRQQQTLKRAPAVPPTNPTPLLFGGLFFVILVAALFMFKRQPHKTVTSNKPIPEIKSERVTQAKTTVKKAESMQNNLDELNESLDSIDQKLKELRRKI